MANSPQAIKRARQSKKRYLKNRSQRSNMRTAIKKLHTAIANKDEKLQSMQKNTAIIIDKMVTKGLVHRNKAARLKSRLNKRIQKSAS